MSYKGAENILNQKVLVSQGHTNHIVQLLITKSFPGVTQVFASFSRVRVACKILSTEEFTSSGTTFFFAFQKDQN